MRSNRTHGILERLELLLLGLLVLLYLLLGLRTGILQLLDAVCSNEMSIAAHGNKPQQSVRTLAGILDGLRGLLLGVEERLDVLRLRGLFIFSSA